MDKMIERLKAIEKRYLEISEQLMEPSIATDIKRMTSLSKEQAQLREPYEAYMKLKVAYDAIEQAKSLLKEDDEELREMAQLEIETNEEICDQLAKEVEIMLIPKDPNDGKNVIVEIRGAAGGDEANIFAGDLYRMYIKYAEAQGWKVELLESDEAGSGGFSLISFVLKGDTVYSHLKYESGAHRVQRVPKTESQGRIHTSTATVLVMPEVDDIDIEINNHDLRIDTYRSQGAGGQSVNTTDSAVRITHIPTGTVVSCQDGRSQHENKDKAMKILRARIHEEMERQKEAELGAQRKATIGTGDRSEKIRTYNYPQNRVTDHRIGLTINQLDRIVEGKLDDVVEALIAHEQKLKLQGENNDL